MAALFSAIWRALKGATMALLYALDWCVSWPFRLFGQPSGRSAIEPPPEINLGDNRQEGPHATPAANRLRSFRRETAAAVIWCEAKLMHADSVAAPGAAISPVTAAWLVSLRMREVEAVIRAGYTRLSAHLAGEGFIDGVRLIDGTRRRQRPESLFKDSSADDTRLIVGPSI